MFELEFEIFTWSIGIVLAISVRAGNPVLNWTQAASLWAQVALLLTVGGALAIYPLNFDPYETGRFVSAALIPALVTVKFCSSTMLARIGLGAVSSSDKPRIRLAGGIIAVMLLMLFDAVSSFPFSSKQPQWTPLSRSVGEISIGDVFYLDRANVIADGHFRFAWFRHEHRRYDNGVASTVVKWQLDCLAQRARAVDSASFFSSEGDGEILSRSRRDTEWKSVQEGSNLAALYQKACTGTY